MLRSYKALMFLLPPNPQCPESSQRAKTYPPPHTHTHNNHDHTSCKDHKQLLLSFLHRHILSLILGCLVYRENQLRLHWPRAMKDTVLSKEIAQCTKRPVHLEKNFLQLGLCVYSILIQRNFHSHVMLSKLEQNGGYDKRVKNKHGHVSFHAVQVNNPLRILQQSLLSFNCVSCCSGLLCWVFVIFYGRLVTFLTTHKQSCGKVMFSQTSVRQSWRDPLPTLQKVQKILPYVLKSENTYLLIVYGGCFHSLILRRVPLKSMLYP